eukprot:scaffold110018_cov69-Phaeocystis_antarctica.AAC.5
MGGAWCFPCGRSAATRVSNATMPMTTTTIAMASPHYAAPAGGWCPSNPSPNPNLQVDGALHVEGGAARDDDAISRTICRLARVRARARARDRARVRARVRVGVRVRVSVGVGHVHSRKHAHTQTDRRIC